MPVTQGFNHIATMTADLDRLIKFYADAFGGEVTFEITKTDDHPRMANIELGGGAGLNVFEVPNESIIGERRTMGGVARSTTSGSPSTPAPPWRACASG